MFLFLLIIHALICLVLITAVLMQSGRGEGLSGAFGAGLTQTLFGTASTTLLTRITTTAAGLFLVSSLVLAFVSGYFHRSIMERVLTEPAETAETISVEQTPDIAETTTDETAGEEPVAMPTAE